MGGLVRRPAWHWPAWLKDRWEPKANKPLKIHRKLGEQRTAFSFLKKDAPVQEPSLEDDPAPAEIGFESPRCQAKAARPEVVRHAMVAARSGPEGGQGL